MGLGGSHPPTAQQQGATVADERDGYYIVEVPATVGSASYWLVALSGVGDIGKAPTRAEAQNLADEDFAIRNNKGVASIQHREMGVRLSRP
jgi:hypothetical protein